MPHALPDRALKRVYGPGLAFAVDPSGNVQVYHADGLGSVRALTDGSGTVIQTYQTDPFGVPTQTQGSSTQPFQFTGQQRDGDGLIYLRARYYDPATGRFFSRDVLAGEFTAPSTLSRFAYSLNNPATNVDSSGLWCEEGEPTQGGGPCGAAADVGPVSVSRVNRDAYADYTKPYEVGTYRDLKNRSRPGDDLEIHHLPQKALARRLIPDYDEDNAPAIALPQGEHRLISRMQQTAAGARSAIEDAQELVRQDIAMLQQASSAPQRAVDELKNLINRMFGI